MVAGICYDVASCTPSFHAVWHVPEQHLQKRTAADVKADAPLLIRVGGRYPCCRRNCVRELIGAGLLREALRWRFQWRRLNQQARGNVVLSYVNAQLHAQGKDAPAVRQAAPDISGICGVPGVQGSKKRKADVALLAATSRCRLTYSFLGRQMCQKAWHIMTGVSRCKVVRATRDARLGHKTRRPRRNPRSRHVQDAMHGALMVLCQSLRDQMPLKDSNPDLVNLPLSKPVQLFRMLQSWYEKSVASAASSTCSEPLLPKPPQYSTFRRVMRDPEFAKVRFHRVVEIGRCAKCCFFAWKCLAVDAEHREIWQKLATEHQWLQLSQKRAYHVDRAKAASSYPHRDGEIYVAIDGGSGGECHLPHYSGYDREVPNKLLQNTCTLPFKLMNGLVHGDSRSHVLLSPGSIIAAPR